MHSQLVLLSLSLTIAASFAIGAVATEQSDTTHFKKITKAPAHAAVADEPVDDAPVPIKKPVIGSHPSPGTKPDAGEAPSHSAASHAAGGAGVAPEKALTFLQHGNERYLSKNIRTDGRGAADRKRLLAGQHPHTIVLSCADSRVPPEVIFDQALGEIFTIRVAGEALDTSVIASVEYAVEHLGPRLLVVMGHTQCGAVDAAIKVKEGDSAGSESLDKLLADIRPRIKSVSSGEISSNLEVESELNAEGVARDLVQRSPLLRKKVESGELVIKPALYRMDSGKVQFH